jgi:DNA helicase-2/ATP-dependent DNA helicase PcrA
VEIILNGLNLEQQEAVRHTEGPVLVLAGAGSGKTRVLTCRIAYLIQSLGIRPANILAITFTNKAAQEMKIRLSGMLKDFKSPWVSTFHSSCALILRKEIETLGYSRDFTIYDDNDQQTLIKEGLRLFNLDEKKYPPRSIISRISTAKNKLLDPEGFARNASDLMEQKVADLYTWYQKRLKDLNGLDFDDLIMMTVQLMRKNPQILDYYQNKFRYILVDEYQDTNHSQYILIKLLAEKHRNLCVVGDPDQSIYGWRGADLNNILSFERDYPTAKIIKLEENYRSTQTILEAANQVVSNNLSRKEKRLWTSNEKGHLITLHQGETEQDEGRYVVESILFLKHKDNLHYRDFAVFYRTHAQSRVIEEFFVRYRIPYRIIGGVRFYQRKEIRDLLAYLRLIANSADNVSLHRIINVPRRGIGDATMKKIVELAGEQGISYYEAILSLSQQLKNQGKTSQPMVVFAELMESLRQIDQQKGLTYLVEQILERSGYMHELREENTPEARTRMENLQEFLSVTSDYDAGGYEDEDEDEDEDEVGSISDVVPVDGQSKLSQFLAKLALVSDLDSYQEEEDSVVLMTLHGAKGLEFPVVFLTGMEEGVFPHAMSLLDTEQLEEERRLCYVGITRAREKLYLTRATIRTLYGFQRNNQVSRFLKEIPSELIYKAESDLPVVKPSQDGIANPEDPSLVGEQLDKPEVVPKPAENTRPKKAVRGQGKDILETIPVLVVGDRVVHDKWGHGVVVQIKGLGKESQVAVAFPEMGIKQLMLGYAPLKKDALL